MKHGSTLSLALFSAVFLAPAVHAQVVTASLSGLVHDPSGAVIPGASIEVLNTATNFEAHSKTAADGRFAFPSLPPGAPYSVIVEAPGFKRAERSGIVLEVNQQASVDIALQLGISTETVTVTGEAPLLETNTATMGQVIDNRGIVNLPLNQRNPYSLVFLAPGVHGSVSNQYNSDNISINGGRPGSTQILVDGIPSAPPLVQPIQGFAVFPSVDAVQEFKVQSNTYSPEFGRSGSGVINLIYKSGTNTLHGSVFDFLRNSDLDANGFFANANGSPLSSFRRNQFGASLGGPVVIPKLYDGHNRTFFFFAYEGLRQGSADSVTTTVPTELQRDGDFSQTFNSAGKLVSIYNPATTRRLNGIYQRQLFPGNVIPAPDLDPVAVNIVKYYPLPNRPGLPYSGTNNYFASGVSTINSNQMDAKMDEQLNDTNRFFFRYSYRHLDQPYPLLFPHTIAVAEGGVSKPQFSSSAAFDYTYTLSPTFLMEFQYGFARVLVPFTPQSLGFNPTQLGFPDYIARNADILMFPGISPQGYAKLGNGGPQFVHNAFEQHSLSWNNTKVLNRHTLKFGWEGRLFLVNDRESLAADGTFNFTRSFTQGPNANTGSAVAGNSIASLLLGLGSSGSMTLDSKNAATRSEYYAWYFGDDFQVNRRLTLNLGIRYSLEVPRTERYDRMNVFDPDVASPAAGLAGIPGLKGGLEFVGLNGFPRRQFDPQKTDWAPRFGFAFQPAANWVLRGGYGIFFGPSYRAAAGTVGNNGFNSTTSYVGSLNGVTPYNYLSNPFPNGFAPISGNSLGLLTGLGQDIAAPIKGDNHMPYTQNWSFDIQRQFPGNILLDAAYVGAHSLHLTKAGETDYNLDQLTPQQLQLGHQLESLVPNPFYGLVTTGPLAAPEIAYAALITPFPEFASVSANFPTGGYSIYHALQMKLQKRFSSGLTMLASFTGQKLIDDYSVIANLGVNSGIQNIYDDRGERAISSNDVSRLLVVSAVYNLPFGRGRHFGAYWNRFTNAVLGGWEMNGIYTYQTGFPLPLETGNDTADAQEDTLRPNTNGQNPGLSGPVIDRLNEYFNTSVFSQPAPFTFGNVGRTLPNVRSPSTYNIDYSLFKNFDLTERFRLQFHAEAYNLFNQVIFGMPETDLSADDFGVISSQQNSPREIQFALKLLF